MRNFQIFIVSAVKICKQCLQTASASEGNLPLGPIGGLLSPTPSRLYPQMKLLGAAAVSVTDCHALSPFLYTCSLIIFIF